MWFRALVAAPAPPSAALGGGLSDTLLNYECELFVLQKQCIELQAIGLADLVRSAAARPLGKLSERGNKRRSLLTGMTILGGYILLSLTVALTEGSYANIIEIMTRGYAGHFQIHREGYIESPSLYVTKKFSASSAVDCQDTRTKALHIFN